MADSVNEMLELNNQLDLKHTLINYSIDDEHNGDDNILLDTLKESNYFETDKAIDYIKGKITNNKENLSVLHLNIQSLPSKFERLKGLLSVLDDQSFDPFLILLVSHILV